MLSNSNSSSAIIAKRTSFWSLRFGRGNLDLVQSHNGFVDLDLLGGANANVGADLGRSIVLIEVVDNLRDIIQNVLVTLPKSKREIYAKRCRTL